jgi:hypothetical protein
MPTSCPDLLVRSQVLFGLREISDLSDDTRPRLRYDGNVDGVPWQTPELAKRS